MKGVLIKQILLVDETSMKSKGKEFVLLPRLKLVK